MVDPRTGQEPRLVRRATVVTVDATTADALSTAFVVGGPALASSYCAQHPGVLAVLTMNDAAGDHACVRILYRRDAGRAQAHLAHAIVATPG